MITFCIPSKNNLRYLKLAIESIKKHSYYENEIFVYVDKDEDGTHKWLSDNGIRHILNEDNNCKGIGYAYDTLFKHSKKDLVVAFHADMILGKNADYNMIKHHKRGTIVSATRIEPPLHPDGSEKIVKDFGIWPEDFKSKEFNEYVEDQIIKNKDKTTRSIFAPWLIDRRDHLGHDDIFKSVFEDTDLFRRFILAGYSIVQSWDSLVYHLTCRGGQFLGATKIEDFQKKDELWLKNNKISMLEYIRKWGGYPIDISPCEPKPNIKYNIGLVVNNCNLELLKNLEIFCSTIYVDDFLVKEYIANEQSNTKFNLEQRVKDLNDSKYNDILIEFDAKNITQDSFQLIQQFPEIINNSGEIGYMELSSFKFTIFSMKSYEKEMIKPIYKLM